MANVIATFTANIAPFQAAMGKMATSVKAGTNAASNAGQRIGGSMQKIGRASTIAGVAVGAMAVSAIKSYGTFQESINKAAVIAGSSNKSLKGDMKDLETEALSLGKTLPISAEDAGNAMIEMARNGASIKDLKTEFPAIAKASAVAGADLAGTATTVQQAMNIWGGGAKNAAKDSAILALNANKSNAEVEDMGQAFANVGSMAKTLGIGIKDTSTAIGLMSNAGLGAAQGSRDLSHALTQMVKPSAAAKSTMTELGISYTDAKGNFKSFPSILKEVASATNGMSKSQKVATLTTLYGAAGAKAMLPLLIQTEKKTKSGKSGWDAYSDSLGKVSSSAKAANKYLTDNSKNMTKNVGQSLAQMADAFDAVVKTSIGTIAPQIQSVANALGNFATWLNKSKSPMASFVKGLIAWSPAIAGVLVGGGLLMTMLGKLVTAISAPAKAIKAITRTTRKLPKPMGASASQIAAMGAKSLGAGVGIGVAVAGFAALAFGVAALAKTGTAGLIALAAMTVAIIAITGAFALMGPALTKNAAELVAFGIAAGGLGVGIGAATLGIAAMITAFTGLTQNVNNIIPTFKAVGTGAILMMTTILTGIVSNVPLITQALIALGTSILTTINTLSPQITQTVAKLLLDLLTTIATYAKKYATKAIEILVSILNTIAQYIGPIAAAATNILIAIMDAIGNNAPAIIAAFFAMVGQFGKAIVQQLPIVLQLMTALLTALVATVVSYSSSFLKIGGLLIKSLGAGLMGKKVDVVGKATDIMNEAGSNATKTGMSAFDSAGGNSAIKALQAISNKNGSAKTTGGALATSAAGGITGKNGTLKNAGTALGSNAASGISSKAGDARSAGSKLGSSGSSGVRGQHGSFNSAGSYLGQGLVNGISSMAGSVMSTAASLASRAAAAIRSALKIHSPSRVTYSFGSYFGQGFANGINSLTGGVKKAAVSVATSATTGLSSGLSSVHSTIANMASQMSTGMSANISGLSMAGAQFSSGDVTQSIDANERITPNIYVQNNVDKNGINSMVKEADANDAAVGSYFRPIGG